MPRIRRIQSSFNSGVLDPRLTARIDVKAYYQGAAKLDDCICIPQGGASRRPGLTYLDQLIPTLSRITGMTITTPNGGTGASANDDNQLTSMVTTTAIGVVNPYVVIQYDLGSLQTVDVIDVSGISLTSSTNTTEFFMQTSTDTFTWANYSPTLRLKSTPSSERFSTPGSLPLRYIRIVRIGTTNLGTEVITLNELSIWKYNNATGGSRLVPFSFNTEQNYLLLFTDRNMAVYKNDVLLTSVASRFTEAQLPDINWTQSADTLLITHVDIAPQRIVRDSSIEGAWYVDQIPLQNIPSYLFAEGSGTNEIQTITFNGVWNNGDTYVLSLSGVLTISITYNATSIASDLQNALRALSNTSSTGISVVLSAGTTYNITFSGSDGGKDWPQITKSSIGGAGTLAIATTQNGVSGKEATWSTSRGWPKTVTFFESRMVFGGSKSRPQGIWLSVTNDLFNFDIGTGLPDEAIVATLDTDQVNEIRHLQSGRKLEIFTSGGEFIVPTVPSIPENFSVVRQTQYGSSNVRVMSIDGSTIFVQRNGRGLREFLFSFAEDANVSNSISQLSSHLIVNPVDIDSQRGTNTDETNYIYVVNTAGDIVVLNTLREQEINAWSGPWVTDGLFKRIAVVDFQAYVVIERVVNSVTVHYLEKFDPEAFLDSSKKESGGVYQTIQMDHLAGKTVRMKGDGIVFPDQVVTGGVVTFTRPVAKYEVGLDFNPLIKTMPVSDAFGDGPTLNREKRIVKVNINKYQTLGLHINGEVLPDRQFDVDKFNAAPSLSDEVTEIHLNGWSHTAQVDITQVDPFPMTILAIDIEVSA